MNKLYLFGNQSPKDFYQPLYLEDEFLLAYYTANDVLKERTDSEIAQIVEEVESKVPFMESYQSNPEPGDRAGNIQCNWVFNQFKQGVPVTSISTVKNVRWSEIFASIAVSHAAMAEADSHALKKLCANETEMREKTLELLALYAVFAVDAASIARTFSLFQDGTSNNLIDAPSLGGRAKREKYKPLKSMVISIWTSEHTQKTNSQASKDILNVLKRDHPLLLLDPNDKNKSLFKSEMTAIKRFETWIGDHKKTI